MKGLHVYRSNRLERLVEPFLDLLARVESGDPMRTETVYVGSRGMEEWLRFRIAEHFGIAANLEFAFPGRLLSAFEATGDDEAPGPDIVCWPLAELLGETTEPSLRRYLGANANASSIGRRRYALARQVADLFDRYGFHCPDVLESWNRGGTFELDERWQFELWTALRERLGDAFVVAHERVMSGTLEAVALPRHVVIFGLSALPTLLLRALGRLAEHLEIHLFLVVPSPHLLDVRRGRLDADANALASAFGRTAASMQAGLLHLEEALGPHYLEPLDLFVDPAGVSAFTSLHAIQSDLFHLRGPAEATSRGEIGRSNVTLHACGSSMRQLEVLRDTLYRAFNADPSLHPRDVVVMAPSIGDWYPLITAVFGPSGARDGLPSIPWRVLDLSIRQTNPVAEVVVRLLKLSSARCTLAEVLDLLALDVVRDRFGLSADDIEVLAERLEAVGLRWGIDERHRALHGVRTLERHTWRDALDRLALSVVAPSSAPAWHELTSDSDRSEHVGPTLALLTFCDTLFADLEQARDPRSIVSWMDWVIGSETEAGLAARYVRLPDSRGYLLRSVITDLERARATLAETAAQLDVDVEAFVSWMESRYDIAEKLEGSGLGGVTFGSFVPSRSIPYRMVCLLGMDEATFPRRTVPPRWDLSRRPGPRGRAPVPSPADDDRSLFLEAILSAREQIEIFYTAVDARTGSELPPCGPVAELLEMLRSLNPAGASSLVVHHPLTSFSGANYRGEEASRSFDISRLAAARALEAPERHVVAFADDATRLPLRTPCRLDAARLAEVLADPARTFAMAVLESDPRNFVDVYDELLPAELDVSTRMAKTVYRQLQAGLDDNSVVDEVVARLALPLTRELHQTAREVVDLVRPRIELLESLRSGREPLHAATTLVAGEMVLHDRVDHIYDDTLIADPDGPDGSRADLELFARLLLACVATDGHVARAQQIVETDKPGKPAVREWLVDGESAARRVEFARAVLTDQLEAAGQCLIRRTRLVSRASVQFASKLVEGGIAGSEKPDDATLRAALEAARAAWEGADSKHSRGEREWESSRLVWGADAPWSSGEGRSIHPEFLSLAQRVWTPLLRAIVSSRRKRADHT